VDFWAVSFRRAHSLLRKVKLRDAVGGGGDSPPVVPLQFKFTSNDPIKLPIAFAATVIPTAKRRSVRRPCRQATLPACAQLR